MNSSKNDQNEKLIFLSHSSEDTWVAKQIAREIKNRGAQPFLDESDIDVGAEFEEDIRKFLAKAEELVVLVTPWSLNRPYVWTEIGAAWIRQIPIVILLHGISVSDFQATPNAPVFLKTRDMIKLNEVEVYLNQLGCRINGGSDNND